MFSTIIFKRAERNQEHGFLLSFVPAAMRSIVSFSSLEIRYDKSRKYYQLPRSMQHSFFLFLFFFLLSEKF